MSGAGTTSSAGSLAAQLGRLARRVSARAPRRLTLGRPRPRTVLVAVTAVVLVVAGWLWLRDSSLVAVRTVEVSGIDGPQAARIRSATTSAPVRSTSGMITAISSPPMRATRSRGRAALLSSIAPTAEKAAPLPAIALMMKNSTIGDRTGSSDGTIISLIAARVSRSTARA